MNVILVVGNRGHEITAGMVDQRQMNQSRPGSPRHLFVWRDVVCCSEEPRGASTWCAGTPSEVATEILVTSQMLLHPVRPPIPELESVPDKADVVVVGAGLTGIHIAQQFALSGIMQHFFINHMFHNTSLTLPHTCIHSHSRVQRASP